MFDKLLEREWTEDGSSWKPVADLADTWEVSPDGLTWTFHLHPGVKWHDGTPFTANDVAFTVSRAMQHTLRNTQNAWAAVVGVKENTDPNAIASGVKVIDDNTISLTLDAPNADFVSDLTDLPAFDRAPAHPQGHGPEGRRDDRVLDHQADRHRSVQVHQVRDRPVHRVRGEPRLLHGPPEDQQDLREAAPW